MKRMLTALLFFLIALEARGQVRVPTSELQEREAIWAELSTAADEIAKAVGDKDLNQVWQFVKEHGLLTIPFAGGDYKAVKDNGKRPVIFLIPLLPQDKSLPGWDWERFMNRNIASYLTPNRVMLFGSSLEFSRKFQGLAVLHESMHAFLYELRSRAPDNSDPDYMPNEERDVRERMKPVIVKLGGPAYKKLLEDEVTRIKKATESRPVPGGFFIPARTPYNPVLDKIFGPAKSARETRIRATELYMQAWFEYLDRYYFKPDKPRVKTKILMTVAPPQK